MLEFINLRQGYTSVKEYSFRFIQLSKYAPFIDSDSRAKMSKFVWGLSGLVLKECHMSMLVIVIYIYHFMVPS